MKNWRGYENLRNINNKTLIIWGDKDISYNFEQVETLNKNIPNSDLIIFKGCSHNVHLEVPEKFNNMIKDFLT
jgi:pimeloyl-ACP methyl ester carboxylesterase